MVTNNTVEFRDNQFTCLKCNSHNVRVKSGMFIDIYICENCGNRNLGLA